MRRSVFKDQKARFTNSIFARNSHVSPIFRETEASSGSWNGVVRTLGQIGSSTTTEGALRGAVELLNDGVKPCATALVHLVRVSGDYGYVSACQQLHGYATKHGFVSDTSVSNSLMRFYKKADLLIDARKLFDEIPEPNVISWNSLIAGNVQSGRSPEGLSLFLKLNRSNIFPNAFSFTGALSACARLGLLPLGRSIHSKIVKFGLENANVVGNCLIDMYGKCGSVEDAIVVFRDMEDKDVVSWNAIVASCARNAELELGLLFFRQMPSPDTVTYNELIDAFVKSGDMDEAIHILYDMPNPNSSSWNTILTGYINRNQARKALEFFSEMNSTGVEMDEFTISIILAGVSSLCAVAWGNLIHSCALKRGLDSLLVVGSALIDMYSKSGQLKNAELMFHTSPRKNLITWNAMISGYAHNGDSSKVIQILEQMKQIKGLKPDRVTFLNLLSACSHNEVPIEDIIHYFKSMTNEYGIKPSIKHCCSMIRAMRQRGEIWRAVLMIQDFGFGSYGEAWRALLGACGTCRDLKVAKITAAKMIELGEDDDDEYVYIMMSNLYAYYGKWRDVSLIRKMMRGKGVRKEIGCSWIEE